MSDKETAPRIYAASRASVPERPRMWQSLRASGVNIVSSWIDEAMPGETADLGELWVRIAAEIASADCLVLYVEPADFPLKGAFIEVGIALGLGKPVRVVSPGMEFTAPSYRPIGSWIKHPNVEQFKDLKQACRVAVECRAPAPQPAELELEQEADGRWIAEFLRFTGVMAYGKSPEEAIWNAAKVLIESEQASPTPEKCPTCGSNQQGSFWRGCRERSTIPDSWHSSPGTTKGTTKD